MSEDTDSRLSPHMARMLLAYALFFGSLPMVFFRYVYPALRREEEELKKASAVEAGGRDSRVDGGAARVRRMRGGLTFASRAPETAALAYVRRLADLLREEEPKSLEIRGSRVLVRGGFLRFVVSGNLLVCVTSAAIDAIPGHRQVRVRYRIRVTELLVFCVFATVFGSGIALGLGRAHIARVWPFIVWVGLFGLNYLIMRSRMKSLFRKVAKEVVRGEAAPEPLER